MKRVAVMGLAAAGALIGGGAWPAPAFADPAVEKRISEIRREYGRINGDGELIKDSLEIVGESTEGAVLCTFRDRRGRLRKMVSRYYGEMGQVETEYYMKNDTLFFAFRREQRFNRPVYWTREYAREQGGGEAFDPGKTAFLEDRYYFGADGRLVRWIDSGRKRRQRPEELVGEEGEVLGEYRREMDRLGRR